MKLSKVFAVLTVFYVNWVPSLSSRICKPGEDQFAIGNVYNNKIYADGKEITTSKVITFYNYVYVITAFCLPPETRLVAVTNVLDQHKGAHLFGSIEGKLVTNKEWRCVERTVGGNWYDVRYDDSKWPQAYANDAPARMPNISQNARSISGSPVASMKYYCRAWIGGRPTTHELFTRSAYAAKRGINQRLNFHLIQSFLVNDVFECVTHCQDYEECVSINFENSGNEHGVLKKCELNREVKSNTVSHYVMVYNEFDYYDIIKP